LASSRRPIHHRARVVYYTHFAYIRSASAVFVELPAFEKHRSGYLDESAFAELQALLIKNPTAGATVKGTGGLRKLRLADSRRGKGRRSGLRVIYYWWEAGRQFWLFTLYDKDESSDLTPSQCRALKSMIKAELLERTNG
jgi:hypothetical protein